MKTPHERLKEALENPKSWVVKDFNAELHKEEVVAKAASTSLQALDMIMQSIKNNTILPDYQSFIEMINDPKNASIKEILDKTKLEILKNEIERLELRKEIIKQRNSLDI